MSLRKVTGNMKLDKPLGLFSAFSAAVGVALLFAVGLPKAVTSPYWPTTEGIVISSKVAESGFSDNAAWHPYVSYRYSVRGKEYISEDIEVIRVNNGNTDYYARQVVERYPVGRRVKVYYVHDNPAMALLEPGVPDNDIFASALLLVIGGVGLFFLLASLLGALGLARRLWLPQ
jgi:hypothetical protein